jgi:hypothetical protein
MSATRAATISAVAVPGAFLAANLLSYALVLTAAHRMSPSDYGELSSLLGLLLISTIPMQAMQTVVARRTAVASGTDGIVRGCAEVATVATVALLVLSPAVAAFLHLPDPVGIVLVAATVPANAVLGATMGMSQGRRAFGRLAVVILFATGGRSLGGLIGLLAGGTTTTTLVGVLTGSVAAAACLAAGRPWAWYRNALSARDRTGVIRETTTAGFAHGSFLLLTSVDVLLARHVLSSADAGAYAVGSIVTRAALWLPQSVVMVMFASLATAGTHRAPARRAAAVVVGLGACCVAGCWGLGGVVVDVAGGPSYHRLNSTVWLFALLGAVLAVLQLAVLAGLAQRRSRRTGLLWLTLAADLILVLGCGYVNTPTELVTTLVSIGAVTAGVALWLIVAQPLGVAGQGPAVNVGSRPGPKAGATPDGTG